MVLEGLADEIVLIDPYKQNIVVQLALDTGTAAPAASIASWNWSWRRMSSLT